jgi:hypothetical protein
MCRGRALVLGLLTVWLAGCTTSQPVRNTAWLHRFWPNGGGGPSGPDVIQMQVALLERPVGDRYLNQDFWDVVDEQVVALERKAVLEDNGFRIGQVGGLTPPELQDLLLSERSCANPRCIQLHAGKPSVLLLGPALVHCQFQIDEDGRSVPVHLDQAQCTLEVVPTLTREGRIRLHFTPQIHHGETALMPRPAADRSGWLLQEQRPIERYPNLSWDVTLAPNEYVAVGARYDRPQTLGHECFVRREQPAPVQRMLVIRTGRKTSEMPDATATSDEEPTPRPSATLAYEAAISSARGQEQE